MERINRGLHSCHKGRNPCSFGGVQWTNVDAHTPTHQYPHKGSKNNYIKYWHPVGNSSGNFLTCTFSQVNDRYGETSSLRCRFASNSALHYNMRGYYVFDSSLGAAIRDTIYVVLNLYSLARPFPMYIYSK